MQNPRPSLLLCHYGPGNLISSNILDLQCLPALRGPAQTQYTQQPSFRNPAINWKDLGLEGWNWFKLQALFLISCEPFWASHFIFLHPFTLVSNKEVIQLCVCKSVLPRVCHLLAFSPNHMRLGSFQLHSVAAMLPAGMPRTCAQGAHGNSLPVKLKAGKVRRRPVHIFAQL